MATDYRGTGGLTGCESVSRSVVSDSATPWTAARQAPLSMGFSRQEYCSGLLCPPAGDLPDPEMAPWSLMSPALAGWFFNTKVPLWKPTTSY